MKKTPILPRCERCDLRLIPLVVQSSDFRWTAAPHRQVPDQTGRPDRPDAVRPAVPPKDDIVGWPDELLINFPDFPDCILDSVAITPTPHPIRCPSTSLTQPSDEITELANRFRDTPQAIEDALLLLRDIVRPEPADLDERTNVGNCNWQVLFPAVATVFTRRRATPIDRQGSK